MRLNHRPGTVQAAVQGPTERHSSRPSDSCEITSGSGCTWGSSLKSRLRDDSHQGPSTGRNLQWPLTGSLDDWATPSPARHTERARCNAAHVIPRDPRDASRMHLAGSAVRPSIVKGPSNGTVEGTVRSTISRTETLSGLVREPTVKGSVMGPSKGPYTGSSRRPPSGLPKGPSKEPSKGPTRGPSKRAVLRLVRGPSKGQCE
ncbi:hypothetical protein M885DRAFT_546436 [Pelagophyceae sp. CCMP2097]|nr:hypothetical protein M885DRAFT_546436 [Pelagophyceae sp. CCMP2097]